jgi:hypothetical protein
VVFDVFLHQLYGGACVDHVKIIENVGSARGPLSDELFASLDDYHLRV